MEKKLGKVIVVLAVLLGVSLFALGCTLTYSRLSDGSVTVSVEDNRISAETAAGAGGAAVVVRAPARADEAPVSSPTPSPTPTADPNAITIELYNKQTGDNSPFQAENMLPGDSVTKNYRVRVSYHDSVTVHFKATVREGEEYQKLAEVMKVRVKLTTTGETLYDGLMRDMPKSLTHKLSSAASTTDELDYEITAYLDTSVGNAYMNKELVADFSWWVDKEDTKKLEPPPKTGDSSDLLLWTCLALASGGVICLLYISRRRKEGENV